MPAHTRVRTAMPRLPGARMSGDIQFEKAEYSDSAAATAATACGSCQGALKDSYFSVAGQILCRGCAEKLRAELAEQGTRLGRVTRAIGAGAAAALLGSLLYYAILALTGYEFGIIAIVVGFGVGAAVRWGSYGRGGWAYQGLAIALTYLSIVSAYVPQIVSEIREMKVEASSQAPATAGSSSSGPMTVAQTHAAEPADGEPAGATSLLFAVLVLLLIACAAPILSGVQNIIGLLIIGFGLYEAWRLNTKVSIDITGPHPVSSAPSTAS